MATKTAYIIKVLRETMFEYMRIRTAETFGRKEERRTTALEMDIPTTGLKLHVHLNKHDENKL